MWRCPICGRLSKSSGCIYCRDMLLGGKAASSENDVGESEPSDGTEMDSIGVPSADDVSTELAPKAPAERTAVRYEPPEEQEDTPTSNYTHISAPVQEEVEETPDAFTIFVRCVVEAVEKHWWKVLLIALVPASAVVMGLYYFAKGGVRRHRFVPVDPEQLNFKYILTGILFIVIGIGMTLSGWDLIGLNGRLLDLMGRSR